jgi:hypothetical protein
VKGQKAEEKSESKNKKPLVFHTRGLKKRDFRKRFA